MKLTSSKSRDYRSRIDSLVTSELQSMYRYACYRVGDRDTAREIIHELYLRFLTIDIGEVRNLRCYLYRSLSNACTQQLRTTQRQNLIDLNAIEQLKAEELQPTDFSEEQALIEKLLATLAEEQREVIRLHLHCNCTFAEIAEILEIPLPTAKSRYRYGIDHLRNELHKQGVI